MIPEQQSPEPAAEPVYLVESTVMVKLRFSMKRSDAPQAMTLEALEAHCLQLSESFPVRFMDQDSVRVVSLSMREAQMDVIPGNGG